MARHLQYPLVDGKPPAIFQFAQGYYALTWIDLKIKSQSDCIQPIRSMKRGNQILVYWLVTVGLLLLTTQ